MVTVVARAALPPAIMEQPTPEEAAGVAAEVGEAAAVAVVVAIITTQDRVGPMRHPMIRPAVAILAARLRVRVPLSPLTIPASLTVIPEVLLGVRRAAHQHRAVALHL